MDTRNQFREPTQMVERRNEMFDHWHANSRAVNEFLLSGNTKLMLPAITAKGVEHEHFTREEVLQRMIDKAVAEENYALAAELQRM